MNSIELPISLINERLEDLGCNQTGLDAKITVNIDRIESFREGSQEEDDELDKTQVVMQSGDNFLVNMKYAKLKKLLNGDNSNR